MQAGAGHRAEGRCPVVAGEAQRGAPGGGRGEAGEGWSPERIPGRLRLEDPGMVGGQRIYDRIRADGKGGGSPLTHLRRRGRKRNRQGGRHAGRGHIPGRRDIPERPETVGEKVGTGDREADTVIGRGHGGAVVSPVDRASEQPPVQRFDGKKAEAVGGAMTDLPEGPGARVHTVTTGSGREFAGHAKVAKALEADFLLPTPHHSWERSLNGHTNGPPPVPAEGDRPAAGHGRPREAGPGHPERAPPQGARPPDAGGGFRPGATSLKTPVPGG